MDREAIRLELLKLRFRHDHSTVAIVADVKEYEKFVVGDRDESKKETGTPDSHRIGRTVGKTTAPTRG